MYLRPVCIALAVLFVIENQDEHYLRIGSKPELITDDQLVSLVAKHVRSEFHTSRDWSVADLAYRSGRTAKDVVTATINVVVGRVLGHFKYTQFDPNEDEHKWFLSHLEIAEAAANCGWIKGAREEAAKEKEGK